MTQNLLAKETSPYLLQHAGNPVAWMPWGPEALGRAKAENKPVLLSVGYAACHWCHVMAHESFERAEIAALMNEHFINIKVDREERPDLDAIYQTALHLLGQQGGWPLTMFLTPSGEPFWGGTYFPPESRSGRPGFPDVLKAIAAFHREKPDKIAESVRALRTGLAESFRSQPGSGLGADIVEHAAARLVREFDPVNGGIGRAPKFPNPSILELVWRAYLRTGKPEFKSAVTLTLDRMSLGGIYDHLGGGYARYSTDDHWLVPHFEKMLYDNAQLIDLLCWVWQDTKNPIYAERVRETVEWALREMLTKEGGFAASFDADSEGHEGKFYVWRPAEIDRLLGPAAEAFKRVYDVTEAGNWEGNSILHRNHRNGVYLASSETELAKTRAILFPERAKRVWPGWDDKVLADWNGLMIAALANAARVFQDPQWLQAAERAFGFVATAMTVDGRLLHSYRHGQARHTGTLDDYANMARAALALYDATGAAEYRVSAQSWLAILDRHYLDAADGAYFFTADDAESLIIRTKSAADNATPAGNSVAAGVAARLYYLTGEDSFRRRAGAITDAFSGAVADNFFPLATLFSSLELLQDATQIVIIGERARADTADLFGAVYESPSIKRVLQVLGPFDALPGTHPAHGKQQIGGRATAYVCRGATCSRPLTDRRALSAELSPRSVDA